MVGQRVGRFTIVAKLGEGGMGAVWKAEDDVLRRIVALKFLPDHLVGSSEARERFLREARAASSLDDARLATVHDFGEHEGRQYIAVEFVDGKTLHDMVASGPVPLGDAVRIVADAAEGLEHAHARGVIHRDITARNIMCTRDGRTKVIDFGLATRFDTSRISSSGTTVGTLGYVAPEVLGGGNADRRSDVYSLGVVLYQLTTGVLPHRYQIPAAQVYATMQEAPEPPGLTRPEMSRALERLILRALSKEPDRRPQSALAFARELRAVRLEPAGGPRPPRPRTPVAARGHRRGAAPGTRATRRLAVLPFRQADASGPDALAMGLGEALRAQLSRVPGIQVIASAQAQSTPGSVDAIEVGKALGAALVLSGAIRYEGQRLRVSYSIVETRRGTQVAGDTLDGALTDLFATEDAVLASVLRGLQADEASRGSRPARDPDPASYKQYLEALGHMYRTDSLEEVDRAIALLEDLAAKQGPTAAVQAQLGKAYLHKYDRTLDPTWHARAEAANRLALGLDPNSSDVLVTSARIDMRNGRFERAIATLEQCLVVDTHNVVAWAILAQVYRRNGRFGEAEEAARRAIELDPMNWNGHEQLGHVCFRTGRNEEAIASWARVVELVPDHGTALAGLGAAHSRAGRLEEATAAYERAVVVQPTATAYFGLGTVYFIRGDTQRSLEAFRRSVELQPRDPRAWGNLGDTQRWIRGMERESAESLDRAIGLIRAQLETNPNDAERWGYLALWLAKRGYHAEAGDQLRRALVLAPDNVSLLAMAITVHHLGGRRSEAVDALRRAVEAGYPKLDLGRDPELEGLREEAAVRELLGLAARRNVHTAAGEENRRSEMPKKPVKIGLDANGNVTVDKDPIKVKWRLNEEVEWSCDVGTVRIEFKGPNGSPFNPTPASYNSKVPSGPVMKRARARYKYNIVLKPTGSTGTVRLDPMVDVDDGGPPRPNGKKAAKKKAAKKKAGKKKAGKKKAASRRKGGKKKAARKSAKKKR